MDTNESKPAANPNLTRTGIMKAIMGPMMAALKGVEGLDLTDKATLRRTFRAVVTVGVRMMLDAGTEPGFILAQCIEAIGHELEERGMLAKAQVAEAKAEGGIAILPVPGKSNLPN